MNNQLASPDFLRTENRQASVLTLVTDPSEISVAGLLIDSLRTFGGPLCTSPVWVSYAESLPGIESLLEKPGVHLLPLHLAEPYRSYPFAYKAFAPIQFIEQVAIQSNSLIWLDYSTIILKPPVLFELSPEYQAALRPVHIRNVGLRASEPIDDYWAGIYATVGLEEGPGEQTIESFIDAQLIRPYFNCGAYALNPASGVFSAWWNTFQHLINDPVYQQRACQDKMHAIFLHQAIFSALISKHIPWNQIRHLPPDYGYPLHLHEDLPLQRQASQIDDLTCLLWYEEYEGEQEIPMAMSSRMREWLGTRRRPSTADN